ncbi:uncharacterized protein LOC108626182 [Ceratina calcarata]|uniref:Uncharacterized protein LOC108626182 n=1 Tax=Ceratina calcarata TaxID=156304 RepID=A0AAJ7J1W9_9HYME|nr:uncharacterized protein LOC108626182 [Ceratina calcarata]
MDLIYVPEAMTCGFIRGPQYRDYEQPWNKDYFNYGKSTRVQSQRLSQHHEQKGLSKDNCLLCKENKRRSLAAYIRQKSRRDSCQEIHEEEEEEHDTPSTKEESTSIDNLKLKKVSKDNETKEIK